MHIETNAIVGGRSNDDPFGSTVPPIYQTATFGGLPDEGGAYDYTRSGNPTRSALCRALAQLEAGQHALAYASGMAALTALLDLLQPGDEIVAGTDLYGGTYRMLTRVATSRGLRVSFVDTTEERAWLTITERAPRLVLLESPTNPLGKVTCLRTAAKAAHSVGALVAVDNSFLSPVFQQPLTLGADLVIHSATKFLGGHADLIAGAVVTREAHLAESLAFGQNAQGTGLAPFDAWLLLRGLKTLPVRVRAQAQTTTELAARLKQHPAVAELFWVGDDTRSGYAIHTQQASGFGSVLAFRTGCPAASRRVLAACELIPTTVSFGSVASSLCLVSGMSHASIPAEVRKARSFPEDLVRLSVGLENVEDLWTDLSRALDAAMLSSETRALPAHAACSAPPEA